MPSFGTTSETLLQALAEGDGELPAGEDPPAQAPSDPTLGSLTGPQLAGFQGYGCVSCHLWQGKQLSQPDPVAVGPELTRLTGRTPPRLVRPLPGEPGPLASQHAHAVGLRRTANRRC